MTKQHDREKVRNTHPRHVTEVEAVACPNRRQSGGNHVLVNDLRANTTCRYCFKTWGDLDLEVNGDRA